MKLFEFEGKALLREYGIPVPASALAFPGQPAPLSYPFVLKAQTLSGGRGKAGGVRLCANEADFAKNAAEIMALTVKGNPVCGLLAEEAASIRQELYLAISLQGTSRPRLIACASGGMEIETLAKTAPEQILSLELDPFDGLSEEQTDELIRFLALAEESGIRELLSGLQRCFYETDALLAEINPLGLTDAGLVALDAKLELDDKAEFRHEELFARLREGRSSLVNYHEEKSDGTTITFVPLDGDIGLISDGAGTGMLTLDLLHDMGGRAASFCELGGTTPASTMYRAMEYTCANKKLKSLLIVLIGGFNRMDDMAKGIHAYVADRDLDIPIFTRMVGNMEETGKMIMSAAGLRTYSDLTQTVAHAVAAAKR